MKLDEAARYLEQIVDLNSCLHGTLVAIEIPNRMYQSIRHVIEEAHCCKRMIRISEVITGIAVKHKSITLSLHKTSVDITIWPEDKAPEHFEWDEILFSPKLSGTPTVGAGMSMTRPDIDPIVCFADLINTAHMLTMERPEKIRMNAAAIHEMMIAVDTSSHIATRHVGSKSLLLNDVRLVALPNTSMKGKSAHTMTVDEAERIPYETAIAGRTSVMTDPWAEFGSVIWKGQTEKSNDLFDLEEEMDIMVKNLRG